MGKLLLELDQAVVRGEGENVFGPISLRIHTRERIWLDGFSPKQMVNLEKLLSGARSPVKGRLIEPQRIQVQGDGLMMERLDFRESISDYLDAPGTPDMVRMEDRRRSVRVLVDRLGLSPRDLRNPVRLLGEEIKIKYLVLRLLLSRAEVLLWSWVITQADPASTKQLQLHWKEFRGAILAAGSREDLPGPPTSVLRYDSAQDIVLEEKFQTP